MAFFWSLLMLLLTPEVLSLMGLSRTSPPEEEVVVAVEVGWWLGERSERGLLGDIVAFSFSFFFSLISLVWFWMIASPFLSECVWTQH